mmetsp:Transcript_10006/g.29691  ORF Transcript_10006/g.29691 Transcript_10006/m.29691 type:complete len:250 (+) Transcript_10006:416-1165(+)
MMPSTADILRPLALTIFINAVTKYPRVVTSSNGLSTHSHNSSTMSSKVYPSTVASLEYSPSTQAMTCTRMSDSVGFSSSLRYVLTANARNSLSFCSSSPVPSATRRMRLYAVSDGTKSPPNSKTVFMVLTYHSLSGAYRSAIEVTFCTRSRLRCASTLVRMWNVSLSQTTVAFAGFVMRNSRSNVLRLRVSSGSSKQSTTTIWCSDAYDGLTWTIWAKPVTPKYFKLWLSLEMNREMFEAASSMSEWSG